MGPVSEWMKIGGSCRIIRACDPSVIVAFFFNLSFLTEGFSNLTKPLLVVFVHSLRNLFKSLSLVVLDLCQPDGPRIIR